MEIKKHFALFSHFTVDVRTIYDKKYSLVDGNVMRLNDFFFFFFLATCVCISIALGKVKKCSKIVFKIFIPIILTSSHACLLLIFMKIKAHTQRRRRKTQFRLLISMRRIIP